MVCVWGGLFYWCGLRNPRDPTIHCSHGSYTIALVGVIQPAAGTHHTGTCDPSPPPPRSRLKNPQVGGWADRRPPEKERQTIILSKNKGLPRWEERTAQESNGM